jgi:hypothetical protein
MGNFFLMGGAIAPLLPSRSLKSATEFIKKYFHFSRSLFFSK